MKFDAAIFTPMFKNTYSGVGTYARMLVNGLNESGAKVCVVSPDCDHNPPGYLKTKNRSYDFTPNRWLSNSIAYNKALDGLKGKAGIAHFLDAREFALVKRPPGFKIIGSVHDSYSWDLQSQSLLREYFHDWIKRLIYYTVLFEIEKKTYKKFDYLIANTKFVEGRLIDFYDVPREKTRTVYIGAPLKNTANNKELTPPYIIGFIGGNFRRKGLMPLVKGVKLLREKGIDISIRVAGQDKNQPLIEKEIKALGGADFVIFYGYIKPESVPAFLMSAHIFAMPSLVEAFGLVYLEAMACGVPALGTIHGGTKELIKNGENGYLCNPYNPEDIAEKIETLLNPEARKRVIENGHETVKKYGITDSVAKTIGVYMNL